jgi:hypothetical protein
MEGNGRSLSEGGAGHRRDYFGFMTPRGSQKLFLSSIEYIDGHICGRSPQKSMSGKFISELVALHEGCGR